MKQVYRDGQWVLEQDKPLMTGMELPKAPASVYEDEEVIEFDTKNLPFKQVKNRHIVVMIDRYKKPINSRVVRPQKAQGAPTKGTVVALDEDNIKDIKIGDKILYSQFAGYLLAFEGIPLMRTIGYDEVLSTLKDDTPELMLEGV